MKYESEIAKLRKDHERYEKLEAALIRSIERQISRTFSGTNSRNLVQIGSYDTIGIFIENAIDAYDSYGSDDPNEKNKERRENTKELLEQLRDSWNRLTEEASPDCYNSDKPAGRRLDKFTVENATSRKRQLNNLIKCLNEVYNIAVDICDLHEETNADTVDEYKTNIEDFSALKGIPEAIEDADSLADYLDDHEDFLEAVQTLVDILIELDEGLNKSGELM